MRHGWATKSPDRASCPASAGFGFAERGRFARNSFNGEDGVAMDGDVAAGFLGADVERERTRVTPVLSQPERGRLPHQGGPEPHREHVHRPLPIRAAALDHVGPGWVTLRQGRCGRDRSPVASSMGSFACVFLLGGRRRRSPGNTGPGPSLNPAASASTIGACFNGGTRCSRFGFMRPARTVHAAPSRSISSQVGQRAAAEPTEVSTGNPSASFDDSPARALPSAFALRRDR